MSAAKGNYKMRVFGLFKGLPYGNCNEDITEYAEIKNEIPKEKIIKYIESDAVEKWYTSANSRDVFTGEKLTAGKFVDGDFVFPMEFLHYYKNYDIGIPYDYEEYLKGKIDY